MGKFISEDNLTTTTTVSSITINEVEQLGSGLQTYYKKNTLVVIHGSHGNSYVPYCVGKALSSTQDSVHVLLYTIQNGTTWKEGTTTITISVREVLTSNFQLTKQNRIPEKNKYIMYSHANFIHQ